MKKRIAGRSNGRQLRAEDFKALISAGTLKEVRGVSSVTITCERCHHFERFRPNSATVRETKLHRSDSVNHVAAYHNSTLHEARALAATQTARVEPIEAEVRS